MKVNKTRDKLRKQVAAYFDGLVIGYAKENNLSEDLAELRVKQAIDHVRNQMQ